MLGNERKVRQAVLRPQRAQLYGQSMVAIKTTNTVAKPRRFALRLPEMPENAIEPGFRWSRFEPGDAGRTSSRGKGTGLGASIRLDGRESDVQMV